MPRYINADKLNKKKKYSFQTQGGCFPKSEWFIKADDFFAAPTEDVVKVIRCKDCESFISRNGANWCEEHSDGWGDHIVYVDEDDFCSFGVRKTD